METNETTELDTSTPEVSEATSEETYTIKIGGEEQAVSLEELQNGYQRQADYTRKTQELSRERERLAQGEAIVQALESDPQGAISALGDAFGIGLGNQTTEDAESFEDLDPEEVRLRRLESAIEEQERAARQHNLQNELTGLRDKYNDNIDENQLYSHALKHNIGNLEAAYTHMTYGKMQSKARDAEIVEEKRAATVVESKVGAPAGNVERAAKAISSVRDAYLLATEQS